MRGKIYTKRQKSITEKINNIQGVINVAVLSWHATNKYNVFSPYFLKTDGNEENVNPGNILFENFWQGSKVFSIVYPIETYCHYTKKGNPKYLTWKYDLENLGDYEVHFDKTTNVICDEYYNWRNKVFNNDKPVRYPNGINNRNLTCFSLLIKQDGSQERLTYIDARKRIYVQEYNRLIRALPKYNELLNTVRNGADICIFEIDVPSNGKKGKYGACCDANGLYEATLSTLNDLLNDPSEAFGHGLCIALALLQDLQ